MVSARAMVKDVKVAEQRLRVDFQEAPRQTLYVLFMDELTSGFDALRVWNGSGEAGALMISWVPPSSGGSWAGGPGRIHATTVAGSDHRLWGDEHHAAGREGDVM